jgi:hypothetical protein
VKLHPIALVALLACSSPPPPDPVAATASVPEPPKIEAPFPGRIVAIGDLHGDDGQALLAVQLAGVADEAGRWTGGNTVLVQTGDVTDRGPHSKEVIALLRKLQPEAEAAGGRVVPLLGNHEVMNMQGDLRYVSPEDVAGYGGEAARAAAFSETGEDGAWLRQLDATTRIGDTVFVHGGITPKWARHGIENINRDVRAAIPTPKAEILGEDGPLWYRGYMSDPEATACKALAEALAAMGARRMVVGHTRTEDFRIQTRCEGALVAIDVSMSKAYDGGHLGVLEIVNGDAKALYPNWPQDLPDPP